MKKLAPGYALTRTQLAQIAPLVIGVPVTYEHAGIFDAISNISDQDELPLQSRVWKELNTIADTKDVRSAPIGQVVDYWESPNGSWWCTFYIDAGKWEGVVWMVENMFLRGLSMTHMVHNDNIIPYEVSLCFEPARPGCYVYFFHVELFRVDEYKRSVLSKSIREPITDTNTPAIVIMASENSNTTPANTTPMDITEERAAPVVQKPLIEQAMEALPEEHRNIIAARLTEMCKRADDARSKQKAAEDERDAAKKSEEQAIISAKNGEVNVGMLKSQLEIMRSNLGEDLITNYHISPEHCKPLLESNDPNQMLRVVDRVLCAANARMMMAYEQSLTNNSTTSKKRKAEPTPEFKVPETPARKATDAPMVAASKKAAAPAKSPVVTTSTPSEILARAMADTFEC